MLRYDPTAPRHDRVIPITDPFNLVDVAISPLDDTGWRSAKACCSTSSPTARPSPLLDLVAYQVGDPDPTDQDPTDDEGPPEESNPYGLTIMPNGDALVADAAGNDVIRVTPDGDRLPPVARFDVKAVSQRSPSRTSREVRGPPPTINAEALPTSVVVGPDGYHLRPSARGLPFRPGTARLADRSRTPGVRGAR